MSSFGCALEASDIRLQRFIWLQGSSGDWGLKVSRSQKHVQIVLEAKAGAQPNRVLRKSLECEWKKSNFVCVDMLS